jgi:hypothetical protein
MLCNPLTYKGWDTLQSSRKTGYSMLDGDSFPSLQSKDTSYATLPSGVPATPLFGGRQLPSAHEPVKDAARSLRGGSFVALLDCLSASGMFHPCPERGKAPFPGLFKTAEHHLR